MRPARTIIVLGMALIGSIGIGGDFVYGANIVEHVTPQYEPPPAFAPDQVVVAFKPGTPGEGRRAAHAQTGGHVINTIPALNVELVGIPSGTVPDKVGAYRRNPNVRYAEPNYYCTLNQPSEGLYDGVCNFNLLDEQWSIHNFGQSFQIDPDTGEPCAITGVSDADIDWMEVWDSDFPGADNIKIAIVDTGVDFGHPDLAEKSLESWVATNVSSYEGPEDLIGHGTHVAGIAAAATNNEIGIAGVGINAKVGSLKACQCYPDPTFCLTGTCSEYDIAEALVHAKDEGYHVINMSFGGPDSQVMGDAVNQALAAGLVLVASAGNSYLHDTFSYPAAYDHVIAVAATDYYDNLASFSNFGNWVEVAAPGVDIFSTYPGAGCGGIADCYTWMSGTSMASPIVAGAAALVLDSLVDGSITTSAGLRDEVINTILYNADHTGALGQNMLAWTRHGRLNVYAALTDTASHPPTVSISSPADGASFDSGTSISFAGSASDSEDGDLTSSLVWTSDLDGEIGTGGSFSTTLSDGTHTVTASVTDSDNSTGSASITITVKASSGDGIILDVTAYKVRGTGYADLYWRGTTAKVDVYRDDVVIAEAIDSPYNKYTDDKLGKGGGSATYQVCETGGGLCSNSVTVSW